MKNNRAHLRFKGSLIDFTGESEIERQFNLNPSAKDLIESCGVPHVEVFGLTNSGREISLTYNVKDGDELAVFPKQQRDGLYQHQNVRVANDLPTQFVADVHLGKLTRDLRLLGINTLYRNNAEDPEIIDSAIEEERAVLTRDVGLLKHGRLKHGYWLRSTDPDEQLSEVIDYFELHSELNPFSLCIKCNGNLQSVNKRDVLNLLPPLVKERFDDFIQCSNCQKIYWKGTHYMKLKDRVKQFVNS